MEMTKNVEVFEIEELESRLEMQALGTETLLPNSECTSKCGTGN